MKSGVSRRRQTLRSSTIRRRILSLQRIFPVCLGLTLLWYGLVLWANRTGKKETTKVSTATTQERLETTKVRGVRGPKSPFKKDPAKDTSFQQTSADAITIGFAVTVTGCGSDPITEGAAVLKHSIHLASIHGNLGGRYSYQMYAIYHPDGERCATPLESLGYTLVKRDTPVAVNEIQGEYLRQNIEKNGCCGEKELIKLEGENAILFVEVVGWNLSLWLTNVSLCHPLRLQIAPTTATCICSVAYTLIQHPVLVHLDLDVLVLRPLDALFDWMLMDTTNDISRNKVPIMWPELEMPSQVNAFFTRDCTFCWG